MTGPLLLFFYDYMNTTTTLTQGGEEVPVYDVPEGMGLIEKVRGSKEWSGFCWVLCAPVINHFSLGQVAISCLFHEELGLSHSYL